jgi:8-hydroxy-5-deazaflavin:NADPH oxidoreductase
MLFSCSWASVEYLNDRLSAQELFSKLFKHPLSENISGAETLQKLMPGARLVKAYSSFQPSTLRRSAEHSLDRRLAIAIASDDEAAKTIVAQLAEDSGGRPFDLGSLRNASLMEIPGSFSSSDNLTLDAAFKQRLQVLGY